jgi:anhydro-N-acetylmuramic acid kinase
MNPWDYARRYADKPERLVIGLMSGTSVDGVDAAMVRVSGSRRETRAEVVAFETLPFPADLRERVLAVSHGEGNAEAVSRLSFALGALCAGAARAVVERSQVAPDEIDLIASHGQTVSHTAPDATLQIGEAAVIAERLRLPVVSDFRTADLAAGGQGAPLVPYADWCLLTHPTHSRAVQNIGGIGNVTYLPADAAPEQVIGFDTGPGNMLIDRAVTWATDGVQTFDSDGRLSAAGEIHTALLDRFLDDAFLAKTPPKSAGREEYGEAFFARFLRTAEAQKVRQNDVVATLTAFTAYSIADAYRRHLSQMPDEIIIGGGGARNPTLMRLLAEKIAPIPVLTHEDVGMNSDSKEAVAFAVLANETMLGNPSNLPSVTGATRPVVLGKVTLP